MASTLNEESVEKKLQNVTNTQDSIQTLSLWIIHHKAHHKKIVRLWFKVLRKAKVPQRLTLFYLCNDVVQHGRKKATVYLESFRTILKDAVMFVRDPSIRQNVLRILKIWEERNVFKGAYIEDLRSLLGSNNNKEQTKEKEKAKAKEKAKEKEKSKEKEKPAEEPSKPKVEVDQKILAEFKPQKLFDKLTSFKRSEADLDLRSKQLSHLRLDASSIEAVKQLKDRAHGNEFSQQFEDSCVKLEDFVLSYEKGVQDHMALIKALEEGELFYQAQYGEAKIVAHAYKIFGTKLNNLKKKLDELKKTLPEPASPVPSPTVDAPSPGSTPLYEPDIEAVDMEMSDDDTPSHSSPTQTAGRKRQESTTTTKSIPQPIPSVTEIRMKIQAKRESHKSKTQSTPQKEKSVKFTSPKHSEEAATEANESNNLEDRIANMLPNLPMGERKDQKLSDPAESDSSHWNGSQQRSSGTDLSPGGAGGDFPPSNLEAPEDGSGTPLKDEGSSTPVQDEAPEPQPSNPIDFLTKLISQTQKTNPHSSNFLQNLGILATTMKHKTDFKQEISEDSPDESVASTKTPPQSWSAWKAKQTQDKPHVNGQEVQSPFPSHPPMPVPPPSQSSQISPTGMVGGYGTTPAMPTPEPVPMSPVVPPVVPPVVSPNVPPPGVPLGPPSPNIPGLLDVSLPPPWLPMSQPPPPPHISPRPHPSSVMQSAAPPDYGGMGSIPMPVQSPDFMSQTSLEEAGSAGPGAAWEQPLPAVDLSSPPPSMQNTSQQQPKGILRNRNSALREVTLVGSNTEDEPSSPMSVIPIIGAARSRSLSGSSQPVSPVLDKPSLGPKPPSNPPGNSGPPVRQSSLLEDQKEFIEKLKRKTSGSVDGDPPQPLPKPQVFARNPCRPNLTTIVCSGEGEDKQEKNKLEPGENVLLVPEDEPKGAPISTINRSQPIPAARFPVESVERGHDLRPARYDEPPTLGGLPRRYDYRERDAYRDRRDDYLSRRHPLPPPRDRYLDSYRDPYYLHLPRDPYGHPTPPKRPYPDPYYGQPRSYYPPRY